MAITVPIVRGWKKQLHQETPRRHQPLVMVSVYDYTFAMLAEQAGVDILLVGDSLGMIIQGESSTLPVTLDQVVYHTRCVSRAARQALVVADMPFLSYQVSEERAIEAAGRLLKEGGAAAVKVEGGEAIAQTVRRLVSLDIPVMGHVGMTPQSIHRMGGFKVQGRTAHDGVGSAERILRDAHALEQAGAFSLVVECVPHDLAARITEELSIPTIGIGAGVACDGQVLVSYDLLGLSTSGHVPKFLKRYGNLGEVAVTALATFAQEVRNRTFPSMSESYSGPTTAREDKIQNG